MRTSAEYYLIEPRANCLLESNVIVGNLIKEVLTLSLCL
jgi:hypothetical protein